MKYLFFLLVILHVCIADRVFLAGNLPSQGITETNDFVNVRILPNGYVMVVTKDDKYHDMRDIELEEVVMKDEVFLVKLSEPYIVHLKLIANTGSKILHSMGQYVLISAPDPRILDEISIPTPKEHITFLPKFSPQSSRVSSLTDTKSEIVDEVDWEGILFKVKQLSGALGITVNNKVVYTPTRYTYSNDIQLSASFIREFFEGLGYQGSLQNYTISGNKASNVIGVKTGTLYPNEIVVIGAHFDSTSEKPSTSAPGANDDGSGSAGVLHLAQLFSSVDTQRTIHFVVFSGEEQGLYGSQNYVKVAKSSKWNIVNAICMDMISYSGQYFGVTVQGTSKFQELVDVVALNVIENSNDSKFKHRVSLSSYGSDHVSFQQAGIPAVLLIEMDDTNTPYYHNTKDTWATLNGPQTVQVIRGVAGSLCDLAGCQ